MEGGGIMYYRFRCKRCGKDEYRDINIDSYMEVKDKQRCIECGGKMERILEWNGPAQNLGGFSENGVASWQK